MHTPPPPSQPSPPRSDGPSNTVAPTIGAPVEVTAAPTRTAPWLRVAGIAAVAVVVLLVVALFILLRPPVRVDVCAQALATRWIETQESDSGLNASLNAVVRFLGIRASLDDANHTKVIRSHEAGPEAKLRADRCQALCAIWMEKRNSPLEAATLEALRACIAPAEKRSEEPKKMATPDPQPAPREPVRPRPKKAAASTPERSSEPVKKEELSNVTPTQAPSSSPPPPLVWIVREIRPAKVGEELILTPPTAVPLSGNLRHRANADLRCHLNGKPFYDTVSCQTDMQSHGTFHVGDKLVWEPETESTP